jgi:thiamine pyrophosphate-dependent acetolactate synthase large subunit-like protein
MRELMNSFLNGKVSRRGFIRKMISLGFTAAAANSMLGSLLSVESAPAAQIEGYKSIVGSGGELMVEQLKAAGVEYVFTNPGSYEVGFFDAFLHTPGMQHIMGLHEGIVISLADGYHKVTRKPAFVNVHVIAGTAQMSGQLYNAHCDGSSLVVTAGLLDNEIFSDDVLLAPRPGFNQKDINRQFTKMCWEVKRPETIPLLTRRAYKVATTQPGGPVYFAIPDYALEAKNVRADIIPQERFLIPTDIPPNKDLIEKAARMLVNARFPMLHVGDEIWKSGAQDKVVELAELLAIPAAARMQAYRNFPTQHPLYVGRYDCDSPYPVGGADLILSIGSMELGGRWLSDAALIPKEVKSIRMGLDTAVMGRNFPIDLAIVADVRQGIESLISAVKGMLTPQRIASLRESRYSAISSYTQKRQREVENSLKGHFNDKPIHPERLGHEMNKALDADAIIVSENLGGAYEQFNFGFRPDEKMWIYNTGISLGWGVGAAAGVKLGEPNRQVVLSIGDGSVMYSASGFWTMARYSIPVLTVVWNNLNYQTVRRGYALYNGKMAESQHFVGTYLGEPDIDFVKLAQSQGIEGEQVTESNEIAPALKRGIAATRAGSPYLIDVVVGRLGPGAESTWHQKFNLADLRKRKV